jgi:hypothetical protein
MSVRADFFEGHVADLDDVVTRLDAAGDVATFARALADLVENGSSRIVLPVQVVDGELVVRTAQGPYRLSVTRDDQ